MSRPDLMNVWLFKRDAEALIKLREYIIANDIKEENLEDPTVLTAMLRASVRRYAGRTPITPELLNKFKEVIYETCSLDNFKTIDLYYLNNIIAIVAWVEYVLYPGEDKKEYKKLYRGNKKKVIEAYNILCEFPANKKPDESKLKQILCVFKRPEFFRVKSPLEAIRSYLESINPSLIDQAWIERRLIKLTEGLAFVNIITNITNSFEVSFPALPQERPSASTN